MRCPERSESVTSTISSTLQPPSSIRSKDEFNRSLQSATSSSVTAASLKIKDYHDCDNVHRIDTSVHTLNSQDSRDLPAFKFCGKIYIREDFRNMISQVKITDNFKIIFLGAKFKLGIVKNMFRREIQTRNYKIIFLSAKFKLVVIK